MHELYQHQRRHEIDMPMNRSLIPMPAHKPRAVKPPKAQTVTTIAPSGLKSWHTFVFLIVAAIIWHYARAPLMGLGVLVGFIGGFIWLEHRFPRTAHWIMFIIAILTIGGK